MRSLGVCALLLGLCLLAPPAQERGPFEPLWALGALLLLATALQGVLARLSLPALPAWMIAGVVLGPAVFQIVEPSRVWLLSLAVGLAGLWAGLLSGVALQWPVARRTPRMPLVIAASTILTFAVIAVGISLVTDVSLHTALAVAALGSMWGPLVSDVWRHREVQVLGFVGLGVALALVSIVVAGPLNAGGWVAGLWISGIAGAGAAELLWRLRLLVRRDRALLSLLTVTVSAVFVGTHLAVPVVPFGLGMGLVLSARQGSERQLEHLLAPSRVPVILLFGALLAASFDARTLWPLPAGLLEILAIHVVVLVLLRGIAPALWYPLPPGPEFSRRSGWLLLPRGLVGGELVLVVGAVLPTLLPAADADLLRAIVYADMLVFCVLFAPLITLIPHGNLDEPVQTSDPQPEQESDEPA